MALVSSHRNAVLSGDTVEGVGKEGEPASVVCLPATELRGDTSAGLKVGILPFASCCGVRCGGGLVEATLKM